MLRIHFTAADLLLTRFAAQPAPQVELPVALMTLRDPGVDLFDHWRRTTWRAFPGRSAPLLDLVHPRWSPDFLDVLSPDLDTALTDVLATPARQIRLGLDQMIEHGYPLTRWLRDLASGDRDARATMETALREAHAALLGDAWERVAGSFHDDLAYRNRQLITEGVGPTLATLCPGARWRGATLEIADARDRDVRLSGTGMTLMPSAFWTGKQPLVGGDRPGQPRLLIYPARIPLPLLTGPTPNGDAAPPVAKLLGRTRAAVLEAIAADRATSTGALAARLGISASRASEHATVLRQAGLITTHRHRNTVLHTPTPLGAGLLNGASITQ